MKVFIFSLQREISQIISDHLSDKGHLCFAFESTSDLSIALRSLSTMPDLLILDYLTYNHDIFNIFEYFNITNINVPVIFYNDPCLIRSSRTLHWKAQLELTQKKYLKKDFSLYTPLFRDLEDLIEAKEFRPYISLLQSPKKVPESFIKDKYTLRYIKENQDDCIKDFRKRNKLPDNLYFLLTLLQKHRQFELSYKDIMELYEENGRHISKESLKVLMSKLKKYIHDDKTCNFLIYHDKDRYRFVRFKI